MRKLLKHLDRGIDGTKRVYTFTASKDIAYLDKVNILEPGSPK